MFTALRGGVTGPLCFARRCAWFIASAANILTPMRFIAPAGTPLGIGDLWGLTAAVRGAAPLDELSRTLAGHSRQDICLPMSSARAAMVLVLQCMRRVAGSDRNLVVIPAYTCYSVLAAVENAGLRAVLCDVVPETLDLDVEQLADMDMTRTLCVVTSNLYGIPNSLAAIEALARRRGVYMLDDAAQSLGARHEGRPAGGFGDVGLYSFDKGKNIATMQGGAIVAKAGALADALRKSWSSIDAPRNSDTAKSIVKLLAYATLLRPSLYGLVQGLPGLGQTRYETEYPRTRFSAALAGLAVRQLRRLTVITDVRVRNARRIVSAIAGSRTAVPVKVGPRTDAVYARFPVLANSERQRDELLQSLNRAGIGATASYPKSLADLPVAASMVEAMTSRAHGARQVARRILTLPTHAYVDEAAIRCMGAVLAAPTSD